MFKWIEKLKNLLFGYDDYEEDEWDWENSENKPLDRTKMNLSDKEQMRRYITECCEQMKEATEEIDSITMEYRLVTDRLRDIEELEQLQPLQRVKLEAAARKIVELSQNKAVHRKRTGSMGEEQYQKMQRLQDDMPGSLEELRRNEEYKTLVKQDLQNLEGEKVSYKFRRHELYDTEQTSRQLSIVVVFASICLIAVLAFLQFGLEYNVKLGYVLTVAAGATALTIFFLKYQEASAERKIIEKKINQAITVQNTVKIRYVNVTNVIDYIYAKYGVNSSDELAYLWEKYVAEKKERESLREADRRLSAQQDELIRILRAQRISSPEVWLPQAEALLDPREMVEIRHGLIGRRQALRRRMEYNEGNRTSAQNEVKELLSMYPKYADMILSIVDSYD